MIGPSPYVMINMGSRFVACMHNLTATEDVTAWPCPNTTSTSDVSCTLSQLCGFGANTGNDAPNQWYRFIIPMFLHAGVIHIGFNMLLQMSLGREIEKLIGSLRFALVYFSSGIFGFVLGGNYAATGISSTGASGCLFGILALSLLDLLYSWRERVNPGKELMFLMLDIVISFVLGLLPGLDNFSHIGGFLMGLILGVCLLHSPNALRQRIGEVPYQPMQSSSVKVGGTARAIRERGPVGFFKGRKPLWWAWWLIRAAALITVVVVFIMLLNNFYVYRNTCSWCKYLSCLVSSILVSASKSSLTFVCNSLSRIGVISATWKHRTRLRHRRNVPLMLSHLLTLPRISSTKLVQHTGYWIPHMIVNYGISSSVHYTMESMVGIYERVCKVQMLQNRGCGFSFIDLYGV